MLERTDWKTAPPLWSAALEGGHDLDRPAILRFATDDFVPALHGELALDPAERDVGALVAVPETWRAGEQPAGTLKLYQPAHGRFYLLTAGLVCARYGLPDRAVGGGEEVFFVLRRLEPSGTAAVDPDVPATYDEFAWAGAWVRANGGLAAGEERLPLFPATYTEGGRRRRVLAGLVPVAAREKYEGALVPPPVPDPASTPDPMADVADPRVDKLEAGIVGMQALAAADVATNDDASLDVVREGFFFAILDVATFLHDHLDGVWDGDPVPTSPAIPAAGGGTSTDRLAAVFSGTKSWRTALAQAYGNRNAILSELEDPPAPVTNMTVTAIKAAITNLGVSPGDLAPPVPNPIEAAETDFFGECASLLPDLPPPPPPEDPSAAEATFTDGAVYVAKCVYHRPHCAPAKQDQISRASEPFRLAHYYDPDAPYRDATIPMPVDTSIEGLRKFPNAFKVAISAQLRRQMDRVQNIKLGDLDDGNIPDEDPGLSLGMICSLSIPIITICALILLMIIVSLLNIVFFWLPLFKICKPKVG